MKNANTKGMGSKASKLRAGLLTSWAAVIALAASLLVTACTQNPNKNIGFFVSNGYISGYSLKNGKKPDVMVIPDKVADMAVIGLRSGIFREWYDLTKIDFSLCKHLTDIKEEAFLGCTSLTGTIVFPASLKTIGTEEDWSAGWRSVGAFAECPKLEGADFSACTQLSLIGVETFSGCTGLKQLKLPASLTKIGRHAFSGCTGLTSVVFENKEGWAVYDNPYDTETPTPISPSDLADPSKAAKYLSETYSNKFWKRN